MPGIVIAACTFAATILLIGHVEAVAAQGETRPGLRGVIDDGTVVLTSGDGSFELALDARLQADAAMFTGSAVSFGSGTAIRRARLGFEAVLHGAWEAGFDVDFAGDEVEIKDAWIGYAGIARMLIRAGQFKEPFSLQTLTSSKDTPFMERAAIDALAPDRNIGLAASRWGKRWQVAAGVFGENAGDAESDQDESVAITGRATVVPLRSTGTLLHVGVSGSSRAPRAGSDGGRVVRVEAPVESGVRGDPLLDSGDVDFVGRVALVNVEGALAVGRATLHAEYTWSTIRRTGDRPDPRIHGGYVAASAFLTGDRREYLVADGEFDRVRPHRRGGAWEALARYSRFDMTGVGSGAASQYTAALTWYANINVRWMANYTHVTASELPAPDGPAARSSFGVIQTRIALAF